MEMQIESWEFHTGPGSIALEFAHFKLQRNLEEIGAGMITLKQVLNSLKSSRHFKVGYQTDLDKYGPFFKQALHEHHFESVDSNQVAARTNSFLQAVEKQQGIRFHDTTFFVEKLEFNLRYVPADQTMYFSLIPSFASRPEAGNSGLIEEPTLFDFFYAIVGFNDQRIYLLSIWHD